MRERSTRDPPFKVHEKGVLASGESIPWGTIESFRWVGYDLRLKLRERPLFIPQEITAVVDLESRDRIHAMLEDWLIEVKPETQLFASLEV